MCISRFNDDLDIVPILAFSSILQIVLLLYSVARHSLPPVGCPSMPRLQAKPSHQKSLDSLAVTVTVDKLDDTCAIFSQSFESFDSRSYLDGDFSSTYAKQNKHADNSYDDKSPSVGEVSATSPQTNYATSVPR